MKRIFRWALWGGAALVCFLVLLVAAFFFVQPRHYTGFVEQQIVSAAQRSKIGLRIGGTELSPWAFRAHNVQMLLPRMLFPINIERIEVVPRLLSLLGRVPHVSLGGALYGGTMQGDLGYAIDGSGGNLNFALKDFDLSSFPPLAGFGIRAGKLGAQLSDGRFTSGGSSQAEITLDLSNVEKPQSSAFALASFNLPFNVEIPAFSNLNSELKATLQGPELLVKSWSLRSSLGDARCTARVVFDQRGKPRDWNLDGTVELTAEGSRVFGLYLPLLSNQSLDSTVQRFRIAARGGLGLPEAKFSRL